MIGHKLTVKTFVLTIVMLLCAGYGFAQTCSTQFSGTSFLPKSGITDSRYTLEQTKFADPTSEALNVSSAFQNKDVPDRGKYSVSEAKGLSIGIDKEYIGLFTYVLNGLKAGTTYKINITASVSLRSNSATSNAHRVKLVMKYKDASGDRQVDKEISKGQYKSVGDISMSTSFIAPTNGKINFSMMSDWSGDCYVLNVTKIEVIGCIDKKIVSENGTKVCAGEDNMFIAKGVSGTCKWEISTDNKATWKPLPGTENSVTVTITDECYVRCSSGSEVFVSEVVRPVVCCSVAGSRIPLLTVDFTSDNLSSSRTRINFPDLDDPESQDIKSTYTYKASGNVNEDEYIITQKPINGGYWEKSAIIDHTHEMEQRAVSNHDGFLLVNCNKNAGNMFEYVITSGTLCSNTVYDFSAYIANIDANTAADHEPVNAGFYVYGMEGNVEKELLLNTETGDLPYTGNWVEKGESFNSGNYKKFKLLIKNNHVSTTTSAKVVGNDIAIDDIVFATCSPEINIYTDSRYKSMDTLVCDDGKTVHLKLEAHAVYDLTSFFKVPYYLFQTSTDKITWTSVGGGAVVNDYIEIDVPKNDIYETGLYYRVWVGGDKDAVEKSAQSGSPGTGCGKLTAVSEPILIQYRCTCSPTEAPTVSDYSGCPTDGPSLPLKGQVTSLYDELRFYDVPVGGTNLGADATFDSKTVGRSVYYVTNTRASDPVAKLEYCESERTPINIEVKDAATLNPTSISLCVAEGTSDDDITFKTDNPAYTYKWEGVDDPSISGTGSTYTLPRKEADGSVKVTATDPAGKVCPASAIATYKIRLQQKLDVVLPDNVCLSNPSAELEATVTEGSGHYSWKKNDAVLIEGDYPLGGPAVTYRDAAVATAEGVVMYRFSIKNDLCEMFGDYGITVSDRVDIPLKASEPVKGNNICLGAKFTVSTTYTLYPGESLEWYIDDVLVPGVTGTELTDQQPEKTTKYSVKLVGGTCEGSGSLTITVDTPANPNITVDKSVVCAGTEINITDSDPTVAQSYKWYVKTTGTWSELSGQLGKDLLGYVPEETYTYKVVATSGACVTESNEVKVDVYPAIHFNIEPMDKHICIGTDVELKISQYPEGSSVEWKDKKSGQVISTNPTVTVNPTETTVYTATVTNVCEASKYLTVTVLSKINPEISPDVTICEGTSTSLTVSGTGVTSVTWSPSTGLSSTTASTVTASPAATTVYTAVLSNGICEEKAEVKVTVSPLPRIASVETLEGESCSTRGVKVTGKSGLPPYEYSDDGVNYTTDREFYGLKSGFTKLYIKDDVECKSDTTIQLVPFAIAPDKFFSPNNDNINDLWQVENLNCYEGYIVEIFDRYNRCLYIYKKGSFSGGTVTEDFQGWDGVYNGHQMPSDDYWYLITVEEIRKQYNGHFVLKR